jgi:hypothetical protein
VVLLVNLAQIVKKLWKLLVLRRPFWICQFSGNAQGYDNVIDHIYVLELSEIWIPLRKKLYQPVQGAGQKSTLAARLLQNFKQSGEIVKGWAIWGLRSVMFTLKRLIGINWHLTVFFFSF